MHEIRTRGTDKLNLLYDSSVRSTVSFVYSATETAQPLIKISLHQVIKSFKQIDNRNCLQDIYYIYPKHGTFVK